jgi:diacylglycerol kinase
MIDLKKLFKSFGYANKGMIIAFREQQNLRIHGIAVILVTTCGILLGMSAVEWSIIFLTYGLVIVAEMFNTVIENVIDLVSPNYNALAGKIKDIAAGAVLVAAIIATAVAVSLFGNKLFNQIFG